MKHKNLNETKKNTNRIDFFWSGNTERCSNILACLIGVQQECTARNKNNLNVYLDYNYIIQLLINRPWTIDRLYNLHF